MTISQEVSPAPLNEMQMNEMQVNEMQMNEMQVNEAQTRPVQASEAPELIRALTPLFIALIGGVIGMTVIAVKPSEAGLGLASTALAGAAGLAQPHKRSDSKSK